LPFAELDDTGKYVHVTTDYADRYLIRMMPGTAWRSDDKLWRVPVSWAACIVLRQLFGSELCVGEKLVAWARDRREWRIDPVLMLRDKLHMDDECRTYDAVDGARQALEKIEAEHELQLFPYQCVDVLFMALNFRCILANPMGIGKSASSIRTLLLHDKMEAEPYPALVICPNTVKETWAGEFRKFAPELDIVIVAGGAGTRRKILTPGHQVYIINWEALRIHSRLAGYGAMALTDEEKTPKELNKLGFRTVIADEAHRAKEPKSKQTRAMWALMREAQYRYPVTGTPVVSNVGDLWSLLHACEPEWFPARTRYLERYARIELGFFGGQEILGLRPETQEEFHAITRPLIRRVPKEAALPQLPPKLDVVYRFCDMSPSQKRLYDQMERNLIAEVEDSAELVSAPNAIAQLTRLLQFASASATVDDDNHVRLSLPSSKVDDLAELLGEMGEEPLVVAAVSRQLIELAAARLDKEGITYGLITGVVSTEDRQRAVERFQAGKIRCILLTIDTGGLGITLTRADTIVFLQRHFSRIMNDQCEDRLHRIGQKNPVHVIDMIAPGTVEYRKLQILKDKGDRMEEILQDRETLLRLLGAAR
jgi:SNF2 family DNA or RNA helicase